MRGCASVRLLLSVSIQWLTKLFIDPFLGANVLKEERLRWLLEDHATLFPYDVTKARQCTAELVEYGKSLANQLDLRNIFSGYTNLLEEVDIVFLDVSESCASFMFQTLHWEVVERAYPADRPRFPALAVRRIIGDLKESADTMGATQSAHSVLAQPVTINNWPEQASGVEPAKPGLGAGPPKPAPISDLTKSLSIAEPTQNPPPPTFPVLSRSLNVLMVVSRPKRKNDIDPLLASSALVNACAAFRERRSDHDEITAECQQNYAGCTPFVKFTEINFEIVRPGSWAAFKHCLLERKRQWEESGGSGPWFDIVHFDVHGAIWKEEAYLLFLDMTGERTLWKSAMKVRRRLRDHGVFFAIFNSCESAKVSASPLSNLASIVVDGGVQAAIAMPFKFTSSAAQIFCNAFYRRLSLIPGPHDILSALMVSRWALESMNIRKGRFGIDVVLPDWIVPVMYLNRYSVTEFLPWRKTSGQLYKMLSDMELFIDSEGVLPFTEEVVNRAQDSFLYGREYEILELEWLLLDNPETNIIHLTGLPGVGKSRLVKFLISWWKRSCFVENALYLSCKDCLPLELITKVKDFSKTGENSSPGEEDNDRMERAPYQSASPALIRRLLVLDHLDIGDSSSSEDGARQLWAERQDEMQLLLEELSNSNVYVMLINRSTEISFVSTVSKRCFRLDGLSSYHSGRLAVDYLKSIGLENVLTEGSSGTWLDYLTCRMQYNPLSITTYLDGLKPSIESRTNRKVPPSEAIRLLFNSLWQYVPDAFFIPAAGHEQKEATIECMNGARAALNALQSIHIPVFGAVFSIPFGIFDPEWLTYAFQLSIDPVGETLASRWPSASEALGFAKKAWMRSGWIEEFDLSLPGGGSKQYMRSHPLFTNTLRILLNTQRERLFRLTYGETWRSFALFYYSKALQLMPSNKLSGDERTLIEMETLAGTPWQLNTHAELSKSQLVTVQAEAANYLQSFAMLLKNERRWQAAIVLRLLWLVAERSTTPALGVDHLLPASSMFFKAVEAALKNKKFSRKEKRLLLGYVNLFHIELAIFHMEKCPRLAANYARDALIYIMRYRDKASYWTADVKQSIAHLLLLRACACSQINRNFDQAEAARNLAAKFLKSLLRADASASVADSGSTTSTSIEETSSTTNHMLLLLAALGAHLSELAYNQASGQQDLLESLHKETDKRVEQVIALQPHWQREAHDHSLIK